MHPENIDRAKRAEKALRKYYIKENRLVEELDVECAIIDLLADLRHFCDYIGMESEYEDCDRTAATHYGTEKEFNLKGRKEWRPE